MTPPDADQPDESDQPTPAPPVVSPAARARAAAHETKRVRGGLGGRGGRGVSPWLAALAGWVLPGAGHWLIPGERWRGTAAGGAVLAVYVLGLLVGGVRVVDVPGYRDGRRLVDGRGDWILTRAPRAAVTQSPWYLGQVFVGPVNLAASAASIAAAERYPKPTARLAEIGTLYTAIAGMLNFVVILDAHGRAERTKEEGRGRKSEAGGDA